MAHKDAHFLDLLAAARFATDALAELTGGRLVFAPPAVERD
jgi:hypothetical protein